MDWTAILGFAGAVVGSVCGIIASQKLTEFRLKKLEEKVDKHNNLIERMYVVEGKVTEIEHDIRDLKGAGR